MTQSVSLNKIVCISVYLIVCSIPKLVYDKVLMQEKLFQRCTNHLYCSVLSLGGNVNTRRMSHPDMRSIFHIKNQ